MTCKYHPGRPDKHFCKNCNAHLCDDCVAEGKQSYARCLVCNNASAPTYSEVSKTAFWTELDDAFRYPFQTTSVAIIVGLSFCSAVAMQLGSVFVLLQILVFGAQLKYGYSSFCKVASGRNEPATFDELLHADRDVAYKQIAVIIIVTVIGLLAIEKLPPVIGPIVGFLMFSGIPASIILLMSQGNLIYAVNPLRIVSTMITIGTPYLAVACLIFLCLESPGFILQIIAPESVFIAGFISALLGFYYFQVIYYLLGRTAYAHHEYFGIPIHYEPFIDKRSEDQKRLAKAMLLLKDGNLEDAFKLLKEQVARLPNDDKLAVHAVSVGALAGYDQYARKLANAALARSLAHVDADELDYIRRFNQIEAALPGFVPESPEVRLYMGQHFGQAGNFRKAVAMLNGLHKSNPEFTGLAEAYQLLGEIIGKHLKQPEKAKSYLQFAARLRAANPAATQG